MKRDKILKQYEPTADNLLAILHDMQNASPEHYLSDADLRSAAEIRCLPVGDAAPVIADAVPWLPPPPKHVTIGVTAGASTPDKTIGRVIERCIELAERCKTE